MAVNTNILEEGAVGVFNDNILATRLDTQERINSLYTDFNIPAIKYPEPTIPKGMSSDDIVFSKDGIKPTDLLFSEKPEERELAKDYLYNRLSKDKSLTLKHGMPNMVEYQKGQEKFTDDTWLKEDAYTKFGFNPYKSLAENEDFYYNHVWKEFSIPGRAWRTVGTFAGRVLSKVTTGLIGMVGDISSAVWNGVEEGIEAAGGPKNNFWADVSDNYLARMMEEADEYTKQSILPIYKALNYDDKGVFSKLSDPYFWNSDLADGVGFLLQFAVPGTLLGKAARAGAAGKLGRFGKIMGAEVAATSEAGKLAKGVGAGLEFLTGSKNVGGMTAHIFNTSMEALQEVKEGFHSTVEDLMSKGFTEEEAKRIAANQAPEQFWLNIGILTASNAFENKWFQQMAGNRAIRQSVKEGLEVAVKPRSNLVGKFFADNKWGNRIYFYGGKGAKAAMMEGYWEENAQLAAARTTQGHYMRKGDDTLTEGTSEKSAGFLNQIMRQAVDASWWGKGDKEAAESIMAGAVIGILGGTAFSKLSGEKTKVFDPKTGELIKKSILPEGERKQQQRENSERVAQVIAAKDAWMVINTMPEGLYNSDGSLNQEAVNSRLDEVNLKLGTAASLSKRLHNLSVTQEEYMSQTHREVIQHMLFGDLIKGHIMGGSVDQFLDRIENWQNKSPEELAIYGASPDIANDPKKWAILARKMVSEYQKAEEIRFKNNTNESMSSYFYKEKAVKSKIFDIISQKAAAEHGANEHEAVISTDTPYTSLPTFNEYNEKIGKALSLQDSLDHFKDDYSEEELKHEEDAIRQLREEAAELKKALPEHVEHDGFVFEIDSDFKEQAETIRAGRGLHTYHSVHAGLFRKEQERFERLLEEFSDPEKAIELWNKEIDGLTKAYHKAYDSELANYQYAQEDLDKMELEEKKLLLEAAKEQDEEKKKEEEAKKKEEEEEKKAKKKEEEKEKAEAEKRAKVKSLEELEAEAYDIYKSVVDTGEEISIEEFRLKIPSVVASLASNEAVREAFTPEQITVFTEYSEALVKKAKEEVVNDLEKVRNEIHALAKNKGITNEEVKKESFKQTGLEHLDDMGIDQLNVIKNWLLGNVKSDTVGEVGSKIADIKIGDITLKYEPTSDAESHYIKAFDKNGKEVGSLFYGKEYPSSGYMKGSVGVDENFRRKGVASAMYEMAEKQSGLTFVPDNGNSELAKKLWENPNRKFGLKFEPIQSKVEQNNPVSKVVGEVGISVGGDKSASPMIESTVPLNILNQVREAYRLHQQAIENNTTYAEEANAEGLVFHNNRIDNAIDGAKNSGDIIINTSNPLDIEKGELRLDEDNLARFNFLNNLSTGKLDKSKFKMKLLLSKNGNIYGVVANLKGEELLINEEGISHPKGKILQFFLDYDLFSPEHIEKNRYEVVISEKSFIPLTPTPITLYEGFKDVDTIVLLKERIKHSTVTASMDFVTQGMLYRDKVSNKYQIPKGDLLKSAEDLIKEGHIKESTGIIPRESVTIDGTYRRAWRLHFSLFKDIKNPSKGVEVIEFRPVALQDATTLNGDKLVDLLKVKVGEEEMSIFEAAVKGELINTSENIKILEALLRPDLFKILNLGNVLYVVNLKKFKKLLSSDNITVKELRALTTVKDILSSPLNISRDFYNSTLTIDFAQNILEDASGNYVKFINHNVRTSSLPFKRADSEGYSRINKRIILSLDENIDDLIKASNQKTQENAPAHVTEVNVSDEIITDGIVKDDLLNEDDINIEKDDYTKKDC